MYTICFCLFLRVIKKMSTNKINETPNQIKKTHNKNIDIKKNSLIYRCKNVRVSLMLKNSILLY